MYAGLDKQPKSHVESAMPPMVHRLCVGVLEINNVLRPTLLCMRRVVGEKFDPDFSSSSPAMRWQTPGPYAHLRSSEPHSRHAIVRFESMLDEHPRERPSALQQPYSDRWPTPRIHPAMHQDPLTAPPPLSHNTALCLDISALFL